MAQNMTDEQKNELLTFLMQKHPDPINFDDFGNRKDLKAIAAMLVNCYSFNEIYIQPKSVFQYALQGILDTYQRAEPYEVWFAQNRFRLELLSPEQLRLLSTRIEIYAKEMEDKNIRTEDGK